MKKVNVNEASGPVLDWMVAKIEGMEDEFRNYTGNFCESMYTPSIDWAFGGPIIEREKITLDGNAIIGQWIAVVYVPDEEPWEMRGPTALIAAMRCFVVSKLGEMVEVPEELLGDEHFFGNKAMYLAERDRAIEEGNDDTP